MNIVRIARDFPPLSKIKYGLNPTIYYISREQARMGLQVNVICKRGFGEKNYEEVDGIRVYRVSSPYGVNMFRKILSGSMQANVIHSHATSGFSYALLRKFFRTSPHKPKYVIHVHGTTRGIAIAMKYLQPKQDYRNIDFKNSLSRYYSVVRETFMWRNADALVTNSNFLKNELTNLYGVSKEKVYVVPNGVDLAIFYRRKNRNEIFRSLGLDPETKLVLYLGGFRRVKGPMFVIEAMRDISKSLKNVLLLFVGGKHPGDKFQSEIMEMAKSLPPNTIRFVENIPHLMLPDFYSAADVVVVPSLYDAFPKVVLEAMACGIPVVASDVGGIPEMVSHGRTGFLVEPCNSSRLAEALVSVLMDEDLKRRLASNAFRLVSNLYTWSNVARQVTAVYERLLND